MIRSAIEPLTLTGAQHRSVAGLLALMLVSAITEGFGLVLLVPMLAVLGGGETAEPVTRWLAQFGIPLSLEALLAIFVALVVVRVLVNHWRTIAAFRFEVALVDAIRERAWDALLHADWRHLSQLRQSANASQLISNVDRVGYGLSELLRAVTILVTLAGLGLAGLAIAPRVTIAAVLIGAAVLVAYRAFRRRARMLGEELNAAFDTVHARLGEGLGSLRVIKSFAREDQTLARGSSAFAGLRRVQLDFVRQAGLAQIVLHSLGAIGLAGLVWLAMTRWDASEAQILPLVALFARALPLLAALQRALQEWAHARPALESIQALIDEAEGAREAPALHGLEAPRLARALRLEGVSVRYAGRGDAALHEVTLELPARTITAVSGPSGAGKSTVADLCAGLIAPDAGQVTVDGVALEGGLRRAWRERVTYVQQEPVLFSGTVRENLLWAAPDASEEQLLAALADASAGFVADLPEGLDTPLGDAGRQLSGGERQRIVLARALLREPALLILDEAASALDRENEQAIANAVSKLRERMAILVIGHRGILGDLAERHYVLEGGVLAAA